MNPSRNAGSLLKIALENVAAKQASESSGGKSCSGSWSYISESRTSRRDPRLHPFRGPGLHLNSQAR